jgi:molybdopterin adenylyltransferase
MANDTQPLSVRIAVLTVSDTRTEETDTSGKLLVERLLAEGHVLAGKRIIQDEPSHIELTVTSWMEDEDVDVIIATGGTGITFRDVTVDVFERLYTKAIPGFGELFRMLSYKDIGSSTIQSRASGGLANQTLLFALPGSTSAVRLGWDAILTHQLNSTHRPCNLVDLMPRFGSGCS